MEEEGVILVDTNAWIAHLRRSDERLIQFLKAQRVRTCDVVVGELLLGSGLPANFARDLLRLPQIPSPSATETRLFIERHRRAFSASGVGWADAQLVLAALKAGTRVHTADASMRKVCRAVDVVLA